MSNKAGHPIEKGDVVSLTANVTLTEADSGKVFTSGAADLVVTLPAASVTTKGVFYEFFTITLSAATGYSVSPNSADKIQGKGITSAVDKDIINTHATEALGDRIVLVCDGSVGWLILGTTGTWAREA